MANSFAIVKKGTAQVRVDSKHKSALIFEKRSEASKCLRRIKSPRDKYDSEIVEVEVQIKRVK